MFRKRKQTASSREGSPVKPDTDEVGGKGHKGSDVSNNSFGKQMGGGVRNKQRLVWICALGLTLISFASRFIFLNYPDEVVFDEVHFGKFGAYYIERSYYFDVHPPLGKLLIGAAGYAGGFNGTFKFEKIGDSYIANDVPYVVMRSPQALLGALLVPLIFMILIETEHSLMSSVLGASMILFDNAMLTQARLILLDAYLIFFVTLTVYFWVRFYKQRNQPFSGPWWFFLIATGVSLGLSVGVKMVGLFVIALIGLCTIWDLYRLLDYRRGLQLIDLLEHFLARMFGLIVVPFAIYLSLFAIHFSILTKSGTGDAFMTPKFQAALEGNRFNKETYNVPYGSDVVLMHYGMNAFLHSHVQKYPLRYDDGRISSEGQQVTGYSHEDQNNNWSLVPADGVYETKSENGTVKKRLLRNKDEVRLMHVMTGKYLLTHDVASPLTPTNQEVTCIAPEVRVNETIFRLEVDGSDDDSLISTIDSKLRIIHKVTRVALHMHKGKLGEWGFGQLEVNGNKNSKESTNIFVITSIIPKNGTQAPLARKKTDGSLSFLHKFAELQQAMLDQNALLTSSHPYASSPFTWPILKRGISFWVKDNERQIYFIGNPIVWWTSTGSIFILAGIMVIDLLATRRNIDLVGGRLRRRLHVTGSFFILGWSLHYFPFFAMGRALFLHHYLPALVFAVLVTANVFDFAGRFRQESRSMWSFIIFMVAFAFTFFYFSPLSYGLRLIGEPVNKRKWLSSWDFGFAAID